MRSEDVTITLPNNGFFANCARRLIYIIEYFNIAKKLPNNVFGKTQFKRFKDSPELVNKDITFKYFTHYNEIKTDIKFSEDIVFNHRTQWNDYDEINFNLLYPFIKKYFSLSTEIYNEYKKLQNEYAIDFKNTCVLLYRGNDKKRETNICSYEDFLSRANEIYMKNNNVKFLLQSDETEFIDFFSEKFPNNSFYFKDKIRHISKSDKKNNVERNNPVGSNFIFSKYYLAITYLMSKCKYMICQSGNTSLWVLFYRNHLKNLYVFYGRYNGDRKIQLWKKY